MDKEPIDPELIEIIACPEDKSKLTYNENKTKLICVKCHKEYEIKDDIPILL